MANTWQVTTMNHMGGLKTYHGCGRKEALRLTAEALEDHDIAVITTTREHCGYV